MATYIVTGASVLREDCNLLSKSLMNIASNTEFIYNYTIGPWINATIKDMTGWIYPFNKMGKSLIKSKENYITDEQAKLGSIVTINPNSGINKYIDKTGHRFQVINKYGSKLLFTISDEKENGYYTIKSKDNKEYLVRKEDIDEIKHSIKDFEYYNYGDAVDIKTSYSGDNSSSNISSEAKSMISELGVPESFIASADAKVKSISSNSADVTSKYLSNLVNSYVNGKILPKDNEISEYKLQLNNLGSVFAMPYQYLPISDMRTVKDSKTNSTIASVLNNSAIGIKYREKILSRMPLLVLMPGVVNFMPNYTADDKTKMINELFNTRSEYGTSDYSSDSLNIFQKIITKSKTRSSYYTFFPAWSEYFKYVDTLCRAAAIFMGLGEVKLPGSNRTLSEYRWNNYGRDSVIAPGQGFYKGAVCYYLNSSTNISESFGNSTTQSAMASKVNQYSDIARELTFISGSGGRFQSLASQATGIVADAVKPLVNGVQSAVSDVLSANASKWKTQGFLQALTDGVKNTVMGAKMVFPDLWSDSSFTRDYSVNIKLNSPDNDDLSVYMNIIVPLLHLIAFAAPRSSGPTSYMSPFLVRAYYQGFFNCNMGIISSLDIDKGEEGAWTYKNIPTTVNVSIGIHDLFSTQYLSINEEASGGITDISILNNQPLMEYLANMCGINYNEPEWNRMLKLASMMLKSKIFDKFDDVTDYVIQSMNNIMPSLYHMAQNGNKAVLIGAAVATTVGNIINPNAQ